MKYRKLFLLITIGLIPKLGWSQMPETKHEMIKIEIGDSLYSLSRTQTQTQLNGGWNVVGWQVGSKCMRYLWGSHSQQLADTSRPTFIISPYGQTLSDFAIIKLKQKNQYRKLPKAKLEDNELLRIDLSSFDIKANKDENFEVTPLKSLTPGEYLLIDLTQKPVGQLLDYVGYTFRVPKE